MHPKEFEEYWDVTHKQVAQLLGTTENTVKQWFRKEEAPQPTPAVEMALDQWHVRFLTWQAEDKHLPLEAREIYLYAIAQRKRKNKDS